MTMQVFLRFSALFLCSLLLFACGQKQHIPRYSSVKELKGHPVTVAEAKKSARRLSPKTQGMKSWQEMRFGLEQSLSFALARKQDSIAATIPGDIPRYVLWAELSASLKRILELLPQLDTNPGLLADEFEWVQLTPSFGFTGYYEPTLEADYKQSATYRYPIYALPPELKGSKGQRYHDRRTIDRKKILKGRGLELAWAKDDIDIFFLQIQGSGRLLYPDGKVKHVLYAGKNGHPYVALGGVLRDQGLLKPDNISMPSIRSCLLDNKGRKEELLDTNPSYVFFRLENNGPVGSMGRPLTPKLSLAVDPKVLPHGSLVFYSVDLPNEKGVHTKKVQALGLPQDSGGAIKGRRVDIFCGSGDEAEHIAGHLNSQGEIFLLLPKYPK